MTTGPFETRGPQVLDVPAQVTLYRWWEKQAGEQNVPLVSGLADDAVVPALSDCIYYEVLPGEAIDFLATSNGSDVHPLFGQRVAGTRVSEHASPVLVEGVLESYRACVDTKRPVFTIRNARDENQSPGEIHILRLPLSKSGRSVDAILAHFAIQPLAGPVEPAMMVRDGSTEDYALAVTICPGGPF
jgi:hypothetical protein